MHSLSQAIESSFSKKQFTTVLFLDISGAFDCAWPSAILAALAKRKCPAYLLRLIKNLFENRTARLSHGQYDFLYKVLIGCPQGGILSPFLWIILAEEIINSFFNFPFKIISYADDIALVTMHKVLEIAIKNLQQMSDTVFQSCLDILLEINPPKSNFMIFAKTPVEGNFSIKINNIQIKPCSSAKFVGFYLDPKLKWSDHIEGKCNATERIIHYLNYCLIRTWGLNTHTLITLYKSIVLPKLLYG